MNKNKIQKFKNNMMILTKTLNLKMKTNQIQNIKKSNKMITKIFKIKYKNKTLTIPQCKIIN